MIGGSTSGGRNGRGRSGVPGRGYGRTLLMLLVVLALLPLLPGVGGDLAARLNRWRWDHDPATPWLFDAPSGIRDTEPADIVIYVDESGSTSRSDESGARWIQLEQMLDWMARHAPGDEVAVGIFASSASPLGSLRSPADALKGNPRSHSIDTGSTLFLPAVNETNRLFSGRRSGRQEVLVLLTDGDGTDVQEALRALDPGIALHVFGLNGDGTWNSVRKVWKQHLQGDYPIRGHAAVIAEAQSQFLSSLTGQKVAARRAPYPTDNERSP